jgi:hypothetical protein
MSPNTEQLLTAVLKLSDEDRLELTAVVGGEAASPGVGWWLTSCSTPKPNRRTDDALRTLSRVLEPESH